MLWFLILGLSILITLIVSIKENEPLTLFINVMTLFICMMVGALFTPIPNETIKDKKPFEGIGSDCYTLVNRSEYNFKNLIKDTNYIYINDKKYNLKIGKDAISYIVKEGMSSRKIIIDEYEIKKLTYVEKTFWMPFYTKKYKHIYGIIQ